MNVRRERKKKTIHNSIFSAGTNKLLFTSQKFMTPESKKKKGFPVNGIDTLLGQGPPRSSGSASSTQTAGQGTCIFTAITPVCQEVIKCPSRKSLTGHTVLLKFYGRAVKLRHLHLDAFILTPLTALSLPFSCRPLCHWVTARGTF